ncbi:MULTISPECIES: dienelactone hydrolase family protein [Haloferax]|uniref:Alpha/beta hydrolase n=2 Tax=Haloferax TaxID=2251 RepID=A0A6G1Z248_9EURY|nr:MULTISPECIES: dienelactone hydrolase family protein [Haloferax]KAB1187980.1 alpha/beta hydrolase [Haloferax sp. CBA1149]MRW80649.1 alpha/beta hydrolase [Haloferax marinisediminis]
MTETILVPGGRDVKATLDAADSAAVAGDSPDAVVVACPPHPQQGGHRGDARLVAVSDAVRSRGIDCLRFDYGEWDEGYGERADTLRAVEWANERYDRVGLFGFSFGGAMALLAAADGADVEAVSALGPAARLAADLDVTEEFDQIPVPVQVVYGTRDDIADWQPVVDCATEYHQSTVEFAADHFFIGQTGKVADAVAEFLVPTLVAEH